MSKKHKHKKKPQYNDQNNFDKPIASDVSPSIEDTEEEAFDEGNDDVSSMEPSAEDAVVEIEPDEVEESAEPVQAEEEDLEPWLRSEPAETEEHEEAPVEESIDQPVEEAVVEEPEEVPVEEEPIDQPDEAEVPVEEPIDQPIEETVEEEGPAEEEVLLTEDVFAENQPAYDEEADAFAEEVPAYEQEEAPEDGYVADETPDFAQEEQPAEENIEPWLDETPAEAVETAVAEESIDQPADESEAVEADEAVEAGAQPEAEESEAVEPEGETVPDGAEEDNPAEAEEGATPEQSEEEKAEAERVAQEKAAKKAEQKAKRKAWVKKHVGLIVALCLVVLVGAGLATGHFVTTMKVAFIHKVEDLQKAVDAGKKTEYIFKSDIIYDGDLALSNVNLDMNDHTLEVKGNLTITGDGFVGYKKTVWHKPQAGGHVIVTGNYAQTGNIAWYSTLTANAVTITGDLTVGNDFAVPALTVSGSLSVTGRVEADAVTVGGDMTVSGQVSSAVTLAGNADISGSVRTISGGKTVSVQGEAQSIDGVEKLYLYPDSNVAAFTADAYYFVQYLEAPTVVVKKVNGVQTLLISHVLNADGYKITVDGVEGEYDAPKAAGENTAYTMPDLAPGNYKVTVTPYSSKPDQFIGGANAQIKMSYYVQLATPQVAVGEEIKEDGEHVVVTIQKVDYANEFVLNVRGKEIKVKAEDGVTTYDITSLVDGTGSYDVYVYAKPPKKGNYETSETTLVTYVRQTTAVLTSVTAYKVDAAVEAVVEGTDAYYYLVEWKKDASVVGTVYVKAAAEGATTTRFVPADGVTVDAVTVTPLGKGYHRTGNAASTVVLAEKPVPAAPETPAE